jgi:hypothetical protein
LQSNALVRRVAELGSFGNIVMLTKLLAFSVFAGAALAMFLMVFFGFRQGRIRHSDSSSTYSLRRQPRRFGLVVVAFSGLGVIFMYAAVQTAIEIWRRL